MSRAIAPRSRRGAPVASPKAIVVPHAGYIYSGPVAGSAYLRLVPAAAAINRVILLGPSHRVPFEGIAASSAEAFATPLGIVPLDRHGQRLALSHPFVCVNDQAHAEEHSLEVQLPFLQTVLPRFEVVPLAVGHCPPEHVADLLDSLWGGPETLVVISTDLSHYHPAEQARALDKRTAAAICSLDVRAITDLDACGAYGLRGLLVATARRHLAVEQLDLRNSGDTAGDRQCVVGYGSFAVA